MNTTMLYFSARLTGRRKLVLMLLRKFLLGDLEPVGGDEHDDAVFLGEADWEEEVGLDVVEKVSRQFLHRSEDSLYVVKLSPAGSQTDPAHSLVHVLFST